MLTYVRTIPWSNSKYRGQSQMSKCFAFGWDSSLIPRISWKGSGEGGTVHTWWREQRNIKGGEIFGRRGNTRGIILGDNPAGHGFVLWDLVPASFCMIV